MVRVFFRNDDVHEVDKKFTVISDIFLKKHVPVHHAVIPGRLTADAAKALLKLREDNPGLIEYGQHGYMHRNFGNAALKFEFLGRGYEKQLADIRRGMDIMEERFGSGFCPAFTPPFHRYDRNTLEAVDSLGFGIFSAKPQKKYGMGKYGFSFAPVSLSFNVPAKGGVGFTTSLPAAIRKFREHRSDTLGVYVHHHMLDARGFRDLMLFTDFLRKEGAEFALLSGTVTGR